MHWALAPAASGACRCQKHAFSHFARPPTAAPRLTVLPAGVKLHRQLAEVLGGAGLQYTAAMRRLLSGRGQLAAGGAAGRVNTTWEQSAWA